MREPKGGRSNSSLSGWFDVRCFQNCFFFQKTDENFTVLNISVVGPNKVSKSFYFDTKSKPALSS